MIRPFFVASGLLLAGVASAGIYSAEATHNLTIQPAGPRQGGNGLNFFNVQGNNNGAFASWGLAEFTVSNLGIVGTVTDISRVTLKLTSANAAFSFDGRVNVWLTDDTATSSAQSGSPLFFDSNFLWDGLGAQLDTKWNLGFIDYVVFTGSGSVFQLDATTLPAAAKTYLINQLNTGSIVRMIVSPNENLVSGTFAGYSNNTYDGPTIEIDATVAPTTSVSGTILFTSRVGNFPSSVDIDFKNLDFSVAHTATNVAVDSNGNFSTSDLPAVPGTYLVSVQERPWLRKNVGPVNTGSSQSGLMFSLINGDVDGDNEISIGDFAILSGAFGSMPGDPTWDVFADLDGDDEVSIGDYAIMSSNFGALGDD